MIQDARQWWRGMLSRTSGVTRICARERGSARIADW